jgi:hypothetical protein
MNGTVARSGSASACDTVNSNSSASAMSAPLGVGSAP